MKSQPQNPEFRNNPENFHPCLLHWRQQRLRPVCANTQTFLSLCCLYTERMEVDEDSDQNLDLKLHWILQYGSFEEAFVHM